MVASVFCAGMLALAVSVGPSAIRYVRQYFPVETVKRNLPSILERKQDMSELEKETEANIAAMEVAKKYGKPLTRRVETERNLEKLRKGGSSRWNDLQYRYDRL